MTLSQMSAVKHWHIVHHRRGTIEYRVWDALLACWVVGCIGTVSSVVLSSMGGVAACMALSCAPGGYARMRKRLDRLGVLRCDWLVPAGL